MTATVALLRHGGSHLIRPIVAGLGFKIVEPGNFGAPLNQAIGPVIVFVRDPRDRMVSTYRWWMTKPRKAAQLETAAGTTDEQIAYLLNDQRFLRDMLEWARIWCRWGGALRVSFENMRENGTAEIARIAEHLGKSRDYQRDAALFEEVYGKGRTYTGRHSDWQQTFGPKSNGIWAENGGPELLELMGYAA